MKEFKKWYSIFPPKDPFRKFGREITAIAGWKAALEWALSQGYRADGQCSLESIIEKELKE